MPAVMASQKVRPTALRHFFEGINHVSHHEKSPAVMPGFFFSINLCGGTNQLIPKEKDESRPDVKNVIGDQNLKKSIRPTQIVAYPAVFLGHVDEHLPGDFP
jgi:hypothetical protein